MHAGFLFGIWVLVLIGAITSYYDWHAVLDYIGHEVKGALIPTTHMATCFFLL